MVPILQPFKLASREVHATDTVVRVDGCHDRRRAPGRGWPGRAPSSRGSSSGRWPRASRPAALTSCAAARSSRAPRPTRSRGSRKRGSSFLPMRARATGLACHHRGPRAGQVGVVAEYADVLQIGARNAQNFSLLKEVGQCGKPVLLKRGMATTIKEFLLLGRVRPRGRQPERHPLRARYPDVRDRHSLTRWTSTAIPVIKKLSHLPVVVDPEPRHRSLGVRGADGEGRDRVRGGRVG